MTPRIAIPVPTTTDLPYNQRSWPSYAKAVTLSGGEPVAIPLDLPVTMLRELIASCEGVLLPGSPADVDPALYGAERDPATAAADPSREAVDYLLLDDAEKHGKPVLGICFGVQSLNVWRGGSPVQDLTPLPVNHSAGSSVAIAHTALVAKDSLLAVLAYGARSPELDGFLRLPINKKSSPGGRGARLRPADCGPLPGRWSHRGGGNGCRRLGVPRGTSGRSSLCSASSGTRNVASRSAPPAGHYLETRCRSSTGGRLDRCSAESTRS